jgi:hypothetical protein
VVVAVFDQDVQNFSNLKKIEVRDMNPCLDTSFEIHARIKGPVRAYRFFFAVDVGALCA